MARHVHVERIRAKTPTKFLAWPPGVLASNTVDLVLADVDAIIVKIITTKTLTVASKIETRNQSLVEGVDVAAHANPKRTNQVSCRAETQNESQSVHVLHEVLDAQSCVRVSTVATLFEHVLTQLHQSHQESGSENSFLRIRENEGKSLWNPKKCLLNLGLGEF